ncbi:protease complex subunit PrcB family protein [Kaarinaea lacus]
MNRQSIIWRCAVLVAAINVSTVMAMGNKPAMDESTPPNASTHTITVEVLYRNQQCSVAQAKTQWIDSPQAYQALFDELRKSYIGSQAQQPPSVDMSTHGVLLVAMGQKNTGGYAVDLADKEAVIDAGVLKLSAQWREPKPGMMLTQALTSPCLLLKIPKAEFQSIEIRDQNDVTRLRGSR